MGAGVVPAPQVWLQTPRDEEEEEHGSSQVSGRAGCGPWALTSQLRPGGECDRTPGFRLTGVWGRVRPGLSCGKWCAGGCRKRTGDWHVCPGFGGCLLSAGCPPLLPPYAGIVCKASSSLLFAERYADVQETWDSGRLQATLFSLLNSGASRPAEGLPQRRLCALRRLRAAGFLSFRTLKRRSSLLSRAAPKGPEVCCPELHS